MNISSYHLSSIDHLHPQLSTSNPYLAKVVVPSAELFPNYLKSMPLTSAHRLKRRRALVAAAVYKKLCNIA